MWISLLRGELFSLGAASFAKGSKGKEGRKEGSWQLFLLEKAPEEFFVPALSTWAFTWLHSRGATHVQFHVLSPGLCIDAALLASWHTTLPGYRHGRLEDSGWCFTLESGYSLPNTQLCCAFWSRGQMGYLRKPPRLQPARPLVSRIVHGRSSSLGSVCLDSLSVSLP